MRIAAAIVVGLTPRSAASPLTEGMTVPGAIPPSRTPCSMLLAIALAVLPLA
jgi:hypothetical protein